ncbi:MAG: glycosyltransferase family 39 protein [Cyanobacteria bacterium J06627_32]
MRRLTTLLLLAICLGCIFRLSNLSGKIFWHDEAYTGLYATGHSKAEADSFLFDGQVKTAADILQLQTASPERGPGETLRQIAENDSQHPPLYYLLVRLLLYIQPDTVVASRLVAAIAGIFLVLGTYWLSFELFGSALAAKVSAALVAVSPFHYLYAQEAREYSLWALTLVLASAACLRALRQNTLLSWLTYCLILATSLYSFILTLLVIASHGLYAGWLCLMPLSTGWKDTYSRLKNFAISTLTALLLFLPWLSIINRVHAQQVSWTAQPIAFSSLARIWLGNLTRLFFDLNLDSTDPPIYSVLPILCVLGLTAYAIWWSYRHMPRAAGVFLALLGGVTLLTFVGPDLLMGGRRSSVSRYLIPTYISLQLAIAYLLSQKIVTHSRLPIFQQQPWHKITAGLLLASIVSCTVSLPADTWWHKKNSHLNPEVARVIGQFPNALIVSSDHNANLGELMSLSYQLKPEQPLLLFREPEIPQIPAENSSIFLFNLAKQSRTQLEKFSQYSIIPTYAEGRLWQLIQTPTAANNSNEPSNDPFAPPLTR